VLPASAILAARTDQEASDLLYWNITKCSTSNMLWACQALLMTSAGVLDTVLLVLEVSAATQGYDSSLGSSREPKLEE
jgi:hypothetical protein